MDVEESSHGRNQPLQLELHTYRHVFFAIPAIKQHWYTSVNIHQSFHSILVSCYDSNKAERIVFLLLRGASTYQMMTTVFSSQKLIACHVANLPCPALIHVFVDSVSHKSVWMYGTDVVSSEVNIDGSKSLSDIHSTSPWKLANSISSYNKFLALVTSCLPS
jgi:hypothetical protein